MKSETLKLGYAWVSRNLFVTLKPACLSGKHFCHIFRNSLDIQTAINKSKWSDKKTLKISVAVTDLPVCLPTFLHTGRRSPFAEACVIVRLTGGILLQISLTLIGFYKFPQVSITIITPAILSANTLYQRQQFSQQLVCISLCVCVCVCKPLTEASQGLQQN